MPTWLKAGLIIGAGIIVINLIGLIPVIGPCFSLPLLILAYIAAGVLAANYMAAPRDTGDAAKQGALAGIIAAFVGGVVNVIISLIRTASGGLSQASRYIDQLPPELRSDIPELQDGAGLLSSIGGGIICGSLCCLVGIVLAAALGAAGGAIYASIKSR